MLASLRKSLVNSTRTKSFSWSFSPISKRAFATDDALGERERGLENLNVKRHEDEILAKLREQFEKEAAAKQSKPSQREVEKKRESDSSLHVTMEEFLDFRRDIVNRLRDLEDDIQDLKYEKLGRRK